MRVSRSARGIPPAEPAHRTTFGRALLACLPAGIVLGAAAVAAAVDTAADSAAIGWALGMVAFPALLAALVLWLIARRGRHWPLWKLVTVGTVLVFVIQLVALSGQLST